MSIFNEVDIKKPAINLISVSNAKFAPQIRKNLKNYKEFFKNQVEFNETCVLLSKLILRRKNSFVKFHGFKDTCKINTALCRLLKVNITEVLDDFIGILPEIVVDDFPTEVPSKSNLEYIIIRVVSYHKIIKRITSCCLNAGDYYVQLLSKGFFVEILTLLLAVVSKIYKLVNILGNTTVDLYQFLLKNRNKFPSGKNSIYSDIEFPESLEKFKEESKNTNFKTENKQKIELSKTEEVIAPKPPKPTNEIGRKVEDFGMIAEFDVNSFSTTHDISTFFKEENLRRKEKNGTALTDKISFGDWKMISTVVSKKIIANDDKNAISTFKRMMSKYLKK
ncbi:hypothetical protein ACFFRR_010574 [Megaselia abdita]